MEAIRRHLNGAAPTLTAPELDEHDTPAILEAQWPELAPREPSLAALVNAPDIDREAFGRLLETGLMRWAKGEFRSAQVETWADFTTRVRSGLQRVAGVFEDKEKVLVVTSAGPIAVAAQWALGLDDETTIRLAWRVRNASVSLLKIDGARAELMSFNSVAHLEMAPDPALRTFL
jgi:broad specificity phosphatase PhoE